MERDTLKTDVMPARYSPLAFLMAANIYPDLVKSAHTNPLIEKISNNAKSIELTQVPADNLFGLSTTYQSWLDDASSLMFGRYLNSEVNQMWLAWSHGELNDEYPVDPTFPIGTLTKTVDGHEFRVAQMTRTIELGYGWNVADIMIVPTGNTDASLIKVPQLVRGLSPPVFWNKNATKTQEENIHKLVNGFAGAMFGMYKDTLVHLRGQMSNWNGRYQPQTLTFNDLLGAVRNKEMLVKDWEIFETGSVIPTYSGLLQDILRHGAKGLSKRINPVPGTPEKRDTSIMVAAKRVAQDFQKGYLENEKGLNRIDPKNLHLFAQSTMTTWTGTLLMYFRRYFNDPATEVLLH